MPDIGTAIGGATSIIGGAISGDASSDAAAAQGDAAAAGIAEQRRQFNEIQKMLAPFVQTGTASISDLAPYIQGALPAYAQMNALSGLRGNAAQQASVDAISGSPLFKETFNQGENAILQNASATGGLRGGNVQGALAQFRPQVLNDLINQQYSRWGGIAGIAPSLIQGMIGIGQSSAAQAANAGQSSANNISTLLGQQGAAQAGGALARGNAFGQALNGISSAAGSYFGGQQPSLQSLVNSSIANNPSIF